MQEDNSNPWKDGKEINVPYSRAELAEKSRVQEELKPLENEKFSVPVSELLKYFKAEKKYLMDYNIEKDVVIIQERLILPHQDQYILNTMVIPAGVWSKWN